METYAQYRSHADRLLARFGGPAVLVVEARDRVRIPYPVTFLDTGDGTGLLAVAATFPLDADARLELCGSADAVTALASMTPIEPAPGGATTLYEVVAAR